MDSKLMDVLTRIEYDKKYFEEFVNAKIENVSVNEKTNSLTVVIKNKTNLTIEAFNSLEKALKDFFNTPNVFLIIDTENINNDILLLEYKNIIDILKREKPMLEVFENNFFVQDYTIRVAHEHEKELIEKYKEQIKKHLYSRGFDIDIKIIISEEERNNVKSLIKDELNIKIEQPSVKKEVKK